MKLKETLILLIIMIILIGCTSREQLTGRAILEPEKKMSNEDAKERFINYLSLENEKPYKVGYIINEIRPDYQFTHHNFVFYYYNHVKEIIAPGTDEFGNFKPMKIKIYQNHTVSCFENDAEPNCEWVPFILNKFEKKQLLIERNPEIYEIIYLGPRMYASTRADCFRIMNQEEIMGEYCFSEKGIPLYIRIEHGNQIQEMLAKKFNIISD